MLKRHENRTPLTFYVANLSTKNNSQPPKRVNMMEENKGSEDREREPWVQKEASNSSAIFKQDEAVWSPHQFLNTGFTQILPSQIPKLFQTLWKTLSHTETDFNGQNEIKNSHSQPTWSYMYCTVQAVWQQTTRSPKPFQTQTPNSILFQGLELSFFNFQNYSKLSKTCAIPC